MNNVLWPWMVEVGIVGIRDLAKLRRFPLPSELLSSFVVFGALGLVAESDTFRRPAVVTAWGIVVATLLVTYAPPSEGGFGLDLLKPVGEFFNPGLNTQAAGILAGGTAPAATGPGKGDTSNITAGLRVIG